jgi:hypothetical protein
VQVIGQKNSAADMECGADSASEENSEKFEQQQQQQQDLDPSGIRIGYGFQVNMNDFLLQAPETRFHLKEKEICVWRPPLTPKDAEIERYLSDAINKYSYNLEQALGLLCYNEHDIAKRLDPRGQDCFRAGVHVSWQKLQ